MMADGYNAKRSGERFKNSPSKVDLLYYTVCGNTVAQNNRDAYCAQIHKIS